MVFVYVAREAVFCLESLFVVCSERGVECILEREEAVSKILFFLILETDLALIQILA